PLILKTAPTSSQPSSHAQSFAFSQSIDSAQFIPLQNTSKYISQAPLHQQSQTQPQSQSSPPQFASYAHLTLDQQQIIYEAISANPQLSSEQKQQFTHLLATNPDTLRKVAEFREQFNRPILEAQNPQPRQQEPQPQTQFVQYQPSQQLSYDNNKAQVLHSSSLSAPSLTPITSTQSDGATGNQAIKGD